MKTAGVLLTGTVSGAGGYQGSKSLCVDRVRIDVWVDFVGLPVSPGHGSRVSISEAGVGCIGLATGCACQYRVTGCWRDDHSVVAGCRSLGAGEKYYAHGLCLVFRHDRLWIGKQLHANAGGPCDGRVWRGRLRSRGRGSAGTHFPGWQTLCGPGRFSIGRYFRLGPGRRHWRCCRKPVWMALCLFRCRRTGFVARCALSVLCTGLSGPEAARG